MRLLMLNNEFPPIGGGTATANYYVIHEMARRGVYVDLVTSTPANSQFETYQLGPTCRVFRIPIDNKNPHYQSERELIRYIWRAFFFIRTLYKGDTPKYDLCHAWSGLPAGALALLLKYKRALPYIVGLRGSDVPGYDPRYVQLYPFLSPFLHAIWSNARALTANSYELRSLALRFRPNDKIEVIPNGVDIARFQPIVLREKSEQETLKILCVARLVERKGIEDLINAVPYLLQKRRNFKIVLVGKGDKEAEFKALAQREGVSEWIDFRGMIPHTDIYSVYEDADLFILPSYNEGMSNAMLEAMAVGLPIITTYTGGTVEMLRGNGILIPKQAPDAIAQAVLELADQYQLRASMGQRSRTIAETLVWERVVDDYLDLYQRALSRQPKPQAVLTS